MPYVIVDDIVVWVSDGGGGATVTALDGSTDTFEPAFMTNMTSDSASLNVETTLLDGNTAVTLIGDGDRTGNLSFVFVNDTDALAAIALLRRPTSFSLDVPSRPTINMTFTRSGTLSAPIHDQVKEVWEFSVGYREVS